jgi:hypothetical protein
MEGTGRLGLIFWRAADWFMKSMGKSRLWTMIVRLKPRPTLGKLGGGFFLQSLATTFGGEAKIG